MLSMLDVSSCMWCTCLTITSDHPGLEPQLSRRLLRPSLGLRILPHVKFERHTVAAMVSESRWHILVNSFLQSVHFFPSPQRAGQHCPVTLRLRDFLLNGHSLLHAVLVLSINIAKSSRGQAHRDHEAIQSNLLVWNETPRIYVYIYIYVHCIYYVIDSLHVYIYCIYNLYTCVPCAFNIFNWQQLGQSAS